MIERCEHTDEIVSVRAAFDSKSALPRSRQTMVAVQQSGDASFEPESLQPRSGKDDCVILSFIELAQPRGHVAS
jgi:hypothetical protein